MKQAFFVVVVAALIGSCQPAYAIEWAAGQPEFTPARAAELAKRQAIRQRSRRRRRHKPAPELACKPELRVVGDQWVDKNGARRQALKSFQQEARFRFGERYADPENARDVSFECVHSSIPTLGNKLSATVGLDTQFHRCSVRAKPCRPAEAKK